MVLRLLLVQSVQVRRAVLLLLHLQLLDVHPSGTRVLPRRRVPQVRRMQQWLRLYLPLRWRILLHSRMAQTVFDSFNYPRLQGSPKRRRDYLKISARTLLQQSYVWPLIIPFIIFTQSLSNIEPLLIH